MIQKMKIFNFYDFLYKKSIKKRSQMIQTYHLRIVYVTSAGYSLH